MMSSATGTAIKAATAGVTQANSGAVGLDLGAGTTGPGAAMSGSDSTSTGSGSITGSGAATLASGGPSGTSAASSIASGMSGTASGKITAGSAITGTGSATTGTPSDANDDRDPMAGRLELERPDRAVRGRRTWDRAREALGLDPTRTVLGPARGSSTALQDSPKQAHDHGADGDDDRPARGAGFQTQIGPQARTPVVPRWG